MNSDIDATANEALAKLIALRDGEPEDGHAKADAILSEFVRALGYPEVADAFDLLEKWYA